ETWFPSSARTGNGRRREQTDPRPARTVTKRTPDRGKRTYRPRGPSTNGAGRRQGSPPPGRRPPCLATSCWQRAIYSVRPADRAGGAGEASVGAGRGGSRRTPGRHVRRPLPTFRLLHHQDLDRPLAPLHVDGHVAAVPQEQQVHHGRADAQVA